MAVTIQSEPKDYTPSDNPVTWTFSSDQTGQANFYFQVDVRINAVIHSTHKIFVETSNYAHFDASEIARANCSPPTRGQTTEIVDAANYCTVQLVVYEYYGATPSLGAQAQTTTITAFKSSLRKEEFETWDSDDYNLNEAGADKVLSSFPSGINRYIQETGEELYLLTINDSATSILSITLYDEAGSSVASYTDSSVSTNDINLWRVDPDNLVSNTTLTAQNFTDSAHYTVDISISTKGSAQTRIDIDRTCHPLTDRRLYWLDRFGGIESYTFKLRSKISGEVERWKYQQQWGRWNGTTYEYSTSNGEVVNYGARVQEKIEVSSDWIGQSEQNWLVRSLKPSTSITMIDTDGTWRMNVDGGYTLKEDGLDDLFNEIVQLSYSKVDYAPIV